MPHASRATSGMTH